jgi:hypothetical protein
MANRSESNEGRGVSSSSVFSKLDAEAENTHVPIIDTTTQKQLKLDVRNSLKFVCDAKVTEEAFAESAEIGLSTEAQRMLHWRKSGIGFIIVFWICRVIVGAT